MSIPCCMSSVHGQACACRAFPDAADGRPIPPMAAAWILEWIEWNGGVCRTTGEHWRYFDTDSQGGRGYSSSARTIWISYPWIDNPVAN